MPQSLEDLFENLYSQFPELRESDNLDEGLASTLGRGIGNIGRGIRGIARNVASSGTNFRTGLVGISDKEIDSLITGFRNAASAAVSKDKSGRPGANTGIIPLDLQDDDEVKAYFDDLIRKVLDKINKGQAAAPIKTAIGTLARKYNGNLNYAEWDSADLRKLNNLGVQAFPGWTPRPLQEKKIPATSVIRVPLLQEDGGRPSASALTSMLQSGMTPDQAVLAHNAEIGAKTFTGVTQDAAGNLQAAGDVVSSAFPSAASTLPTATPVAASIPPPVPTATPSITPDSVLNQASNAKPTEIINQASQLAQVAPWAGIMFAATAVLLTGIGIVYTQAKKKQRAKLEQLPTIKGFKAQKLLSDSCTYILKTLKFIEAPFRGDALEKGLAAMGNIYYIAKGEWRSIKDFATLKAALKNISEINGIKVGA